MSLIISIASDNNADFRSTRILGQLYAADVDRETTPKFGAGAPIDGRLFMN